MALRCAGYAYVKGAGNWRVEENDGKGEVVLDGQTDG